jgi:heme oxygenase
LRARFRQATADLHARVEARLDLLAPALTAERYGHVLAVLYGYYEPLERAIAAAPRVALPLRARAPLLAEDLGCLGVSPSAVAALPRCPYVPHVGGVAELAGCLYVIEGAALGGLVIGRALREERGWTCRFFHDGHGDVRRRWAAVVAWLDALVCDADAAVAAACATFRTLDDWIDERGVSTCPST